MTTQKQIQAFEKRFDDAKSPVTFDNLDAIIRNNRTRYKQGLISLEKYYTLFNNIENFKKACCKYWELF